MTETREQKRERLIEWIASTAMEWAEVEVDPDIIETFVSTMQEAYLKDDTPDVVLDRGLAKYVTAQ